MTFGFALLTIGSLLAYSGYSNQPISNVLKGLTKKSSGAGDTGFLGGATPRSGGGGPSAGKGPPSKQGTPIKPKVTRA